MNYYYNPPRGSRARKDLEGGFLLGALAKLYAKTVGKWGKKRITDLKDQRKEIKSLEAAIKAKKQNTDGSGFDLFEKIDNLGRKKSYAGHSRGKVKARGGSYSMFQPTMMRPGAGWSKRYREMRRIWGGDPWIEDLNIWKRRFKGKTLKDVIKEREQQNEPQPLSTYQGGKLEGRDVVDFLAGPIGWAFMGVRKAREKKIDKLKKQLNGGMIGYDARVNLPLESPALSVYKQPPKLSLALDGYQPQQIATLLPVIDDFNQRVDSQ